MIQDAILNPPISHWGSGALTEPPEDQFKKYTYPIAAEDGGTEIHMVWTDTPCRTTCWNDGNQTVEAFRSPTIECVVAQHPWLENDCLIADIILPANTTLEVDDIVACVSMGASEFSTVNLQRQAMIPVGESRSDHEIVLEIARKMGLEKEVSEGKDTWEWIKEFFETRFRLSPVISWEEFKQKGYYAYPTARDWRDDPPGLIDFYRDPEANPLATPSGKLEFYSARLAEHFPNDLERGPFPKWIEKGITHDERISSERAPDVPPVDDVQPRQMEGACPVR